MEKRSYSEYDPKSVSVAGSKRKAINAIDQSDNPSSTQKIAGHTSSWSRIENQTPTMNLTQIEGQPMSQEVVMSSSQDVDDPLANNLQSLLEIWNNNATQGELILVDDDQHQQLTEMEEQLAQAKLTIKGLEQRLSKAVERKIVMKNIIQDQVKRGDEITKRQNVVFDLMAVAEEHFESAENTLTECEEVEDDLAKLYNNAKLKQQETKNILTESFDKYRETETKELVEQLAMLNRQSLIDETRYQQLEDQLSDLTRLNSEVDLKQEMAEKTYNENRVKHAEEMSKISEIKTNIETKLKLEIEEQSKLEVENEGILKKVDEYRSKCEAQQATSAQYKEQIKYLTTTCCELEEEEAKLNTELLESNSSHFASISEKDSELAECRNQLEDLRSKVAKTSEELIKITEDNKNLSETDVKAVDEMNRLTVKLQNKDGESSKLNADLSNALTEQEELSLNYESLNVQLTALKDQNCRAKSEFETWEITQNQKLRNISEMNRQLATSEHDLKNVSDYVTKLDSELANKEAKYSVQLNQYEKTIEEKDCKIADCSKTLINLQNKKKHNELEYKKKLKIKTNLAEQCQVADHAKEIQEQKAKIDILQNQISVEKLKLEQNGLKEQELNKQKEIEDLKLVELQSKFVDLKAKYSTARERNNDLRTKLQKIEEAKQMTNTGTSLSIVSSPLLGMSFARPEGSIISSTPVHSPTGTEMAQLEISSDLSSIDGMQAITEIEREYEKLSQSNKTDAVKLSQTDRTENTGSTSSAIAVVPPQQRSRKSYKPCYKRK
ncbi:WEB family protein At5g16730, chloroplastic-like [Neodiprion fabricii]|uniref:WEB family protein At5g16730, chloroplastic-like n=1 Tax=Neodiprion fabricii TaxID=2872261 RepID=UPI001ED929B8|nr:WEB family protein At5g16730, chloroplastic-like [Neodiprion fabricii]